MSNVGLAMHMANELLSIPVAGVTIALAVAAVVVTACKMRRADAARSPIMGVMGAFVFAAQMVNFPLPFLPGASGHLGGGVLLAILLGPSAAIVTMTAILIVQCLLFQDGGLLALGCNIINMGVVPCLLGAGVYRLLGGRRPAAGAARQYLSAWAACLAGVTAGAALVPVEASASGVLRIPAGDFLAVMVGVHLVIAAIEGAITFAVLAYLRRVRPGLFGIDSTAGATPKYSWRCSVAGQASVLQPCPTGRPGWQVVSGTLLVTALLLGGVVSHFASVKPDGLEWCLAGRQYGDAPSATAPPTAEGSTVTAWQGQWSPLPDYSHRSLAGILGTLVTLGLVYGVSRISRKKNACE